MSHALDRLIRKGKVIEQYHADEPIMSEDITTTVLDIVEQLAQELRPHTMGTVSVTLDSSLERELGFDSLGRVELIGRLERAFDMHLPHDLLTSAAPPPRFTPGGSTRGHGHLMIGR